MKTYIALLRGINVSGHKKILMVDLRSIFEGLGYSNVQTYIQSGNVVFKANKSTNIQEIGRKIKQAIAEKYVFDIPVLVLSAIKLHSAFKNNPFLQENNIDASKLHLTLLTELPVADNLQKLTEVNYIPDRFIIDRQNIYLYCPNGYGRTKLTNTFFESKLKTPATTRNWQTVTKLVEMTQ